MERRKDFAQGYQDFACALNVNDGNSKFHGRLVGKGYFWDGGGPGKDLWVFHRARLSLAQTSIVLRRRWQPYPWRPHCLLEETGEEPIHGQKPVH